MAVSLDRSEVARRSSLAQITLEVHRNGAISRAELAKNVGFSLTHICRIVDDLLLQGELVETSTVTGTRGRPKVMLEINPDGAPMAGVRLGPDEAEIAVADSSGRIVGRNSVPYDCDSEPPDEMIGSIARGIHRCAKTAGKDPNALRGVGVAVAGLADPMLGVLDGLTNRRGWEGVPVARMLEQEMGVPVHVDNDVRAGALGDQWLANDASPGGALYIIISDGIGAAVVQNREVLRGAHDTAGLLGHTTIDPNGPLCGCGKRGCLEALTADVAFIKSIWPDLTKTTSQMSVSERTSLVKRGVGLAVQGHTIASAALVAVTTYLGIGIANAVCMYDPCTVLISGTLVDISPDLVADMIRREAVKNIWPRTKGVEIRPFMHWQEFMVKGAIALVQWERYRTLQDNANATATRSYARDDGDRVGGR